MESSGALLFLGDSDDLAATLLIPIRPEAPCGDSLDDSAAFYSLESLAIFGRHTPPPESTDWREIRKISLDLLSRSKDLRVLAYLLAAAVRIDPLGVVLDILAVAGNWVRQYPDDVFPLLDGDGIARANALGCFVDPLGVMIDFSKMKAVSSKVEGEFFVQSAGGTDVEPMRRALQAADPGAVVALSAKVEAAHSAIQALETPAMDRYPAPRLTPLATLLKQFLATLTGLNESVGPVSGDIIAPAASVGPPATVSLQQIGSREDALRTLDAVAAYFVRTEPTSPVPLMVERTKRLISKSFLDVLAELIPDSVDRAKDAFGIKDKGE